MTSVAMGSFNASATWVSILLWEIKASKNFWTLWFSGNLLCEMCKAKAHISKTSYIEILLWVNIIGKGVLLICSSLTLFEKVSLVVLTFWLWIACIYAVVVEFGAPLLCCSCSIDMMSSLSWLLGSHAKIQKKRLLSQRFIWCIVLHLYA